MKNCSNCVYHVGQRCIKLSDQFTRPRQEGTDFEGLYVELFNTETEKWDSYKSKKDTRIFTSPWFSCAFHVKDKIKIRGDI